MSESNIAKIAVEKTSYHFDKAYDYLIPDFLADKAQKGCRVLIPFGGGNRKRQGVIMDIVRYSHVDKVKPILAVLDKSPPLNQEMLELVLWLKERTFCTLFEAAKALLPAGLNLRIVTSYHIKDGISEGAIACLRDDEYLMCKYLIRSAATVERERLLEVMNLPADCDIPDKLIKKGFLIRTDEAVRRVSDAAVKMARLALSGTELEETLPLLTPKQAAVVDLLTEAGGASVKEICYFAGVTAAVITTLQKKGIIEYYEHEIYRIPEKPEGEASCVPAALTQEQQQAFDGLLLRYRSGKGGASLLYGVTGSGKTQVFLRLIDEAVADGRGVIMMVPEIALTPQMIGLFSRRYGGQVAVFHSGLSLGERIDEWKRVKNGEALVAVGTRSAVFAPFKNLSLIVMDEEQEDSYKSEASPRFHARDVARFRCAKHNALLLLASATPSIESYSAAQSGRYSFHRMESRYGGATLPEVVTVDMCEELSAGNSGNISAKLMEELRTVREQGRQSILLMNRRGYNTYASCRGCGHVLVCPSCSISMTYHSANGRMMCHYCGHSAPMSENCPECGEKKVRYSGFGTQKLEEEIGVILPEARVLRMDTDTTMSRFSHEIKFKEFSEGKYDIMLGTQMVAKGLDFGNVTLVGVISADQCLYNDDYRSLEKTFALLTQVVGRAGRGEFKGKAMIQTFTPEHPIIKLAAAQDYESFYRIEIESRKLMKYPPYCDLCVIGFIGAEEERVRQCADLFFDMLKKYNSVEYIDEKIIVLGPSPARIAKISGKYRYRLIIKCRNRAGFRDMISRLLIEFGRDDAYKAVTVFANMNPESLL